MVVGKVSSGLLQPACRTLQVLGVGDDSLDLVADLVDRGAVGLVVRVKGRARGFSLRGDHSQPDVPLVTDMAWWCPVWEVGGGYVEQAAAAQGLGVVRASVLGVGDPGQGP